jgi:carboxymethylenebutenolidase
MWDAAAMAAMTQTAELSFTRDGDRIRGYAAWPAGAAASPGLVLVPDVRGLYEHYRDVARRFAAEGFFTFAVDLHSREGDPDLPDMPSVFRWIRNLPDGRVLADLAGAVDFVAARSEVAGRAVGITGFCMGGAVTVIAAAHIPEIAAAVAFYGLPPAGVVKPADIKVPLQGHFANRDDFVTPAAVDAFEAGLRAAGKEFEFFRYDADHAFANEARVAVHDRHAAELAWDRAIDFFKRHHLA